MSKYLNTFALTVCTLGSMMMSTQAYSSGDAHAPAPAKADPGKPALIDAKKPLVDLSNPIKNSAEKSAPVVGNQASSKIPVVQSNPGSKPMQPPAHTPAPAGAPADATAGYARPNLGLSPYYVNPYDSGFRGGLASNGGGHAPAKKHVAKKRKPVSHASKNSNVQTASAERIDGQIRYINQRQNNLESDVKSLQKRQNALESKYAVDSAYSIRNDQ